ncbi:DNA helicase-2/ATP-dependent DNA helicase PcrA [Actinomycetospora succinea]|uniref:DNA 3'-5' helicase n=1 Tax=Actinomycetospora succinea TaxID=663603 RepID=A0A4R6VD77_9PSEU|nr:ATP-dependent DNA helicase [Actinomycetospora succinea]TDQ58531.1 DNA helicase-2/ATP-dependent DNA helicase PcrA [Actinomycetospora succinea]
MTIVAPPELIDPVELAERLGLRRPTEEQAAVIGARWEPALVTAGAGSGKTETMAARVVWLVANGLVRPEQVLGLTFTRKAAGQLADRVRRRLRVLGASTLLDELDPSGDRRLAARAGEPTISTYHAYAGRLLTEHGLRLPVDPGARLLSPTASWQLAHRIVSTWAADLDTDRVPATVTALVQALAGELGEHLADAEVLRVHAERFARAVEDAPRAKGQKAALPQTLVTKVAAQRFRAALLPLVEELAARKRAERCLDFADQMAAAARLAEGHEEVGAAEREAFRAVLLDEYQDTGHAQRVLLRSLFAGEEDTTVTAVGDPFQSIYGWRGASAANLPRFVTDFPRVDGSGDWVAAARHGLLTSFRNPPEVLALANGIAEPLRATGVPVDELRPRPGAPAGDVRVALHPDVEVERAWIADAVADRWRAAADAGVEPPTSAVLVRRRADMSALAAALRARDLPVEVVGLGGLLDEPEVRDVVSALRLVVDPLAGGAAIRLLTGARWRIGGADLAALWRRARELAAPAEHPATVSDAVPDPVAAALPGEHAERAGLVDALDDPGPAARYSAAGFERLQHLARELAMLRRRVTAPLVDLVADVERVLLLDVETAARPGPTGRAHLDAFAEVVADFSSGAAASGGGTATAALLAYLDAAEDAEDGLTPGEVDVADPATGGTRVQVLTVHAAKGLEWELVALPHVVDKVFPASKRSGSWLTSVASLPVHLRGDRPDLPELDLDGAADRKEIQERLDGHERAFDDRRLVEERRLFYVALTRSERTLLVSGHWWGDTGDTPRGPSELLTEVGELVAAGRGGVVDVWTEPPEEGEANPMAAAVHEAAWPIDPLGHRRAAVDDGAALVRAARRRRHAEPAETAAPAETATSAGTEDTAETADPEGWAADIEVLLAERAAARDRHARVLLPPQLSVSQLVDLAADPAALARRLRRPVPRAPDPRARRGTEFHAWLERWFSATELLEFDELPGAADEDADAAADPAGAADAAELRERFTASRWANRTPVAVEVPFETEVAGTLVRGRIDAVFADPDGGATVVDWKTGGLPRDEALPALAVQLAAYRLAWSSLSGIPIEKVRAALHYVRFDETKAPADLLDAAGLRALVAAVPEEERVPEGDPEPPPLGASPDDDDVDPDRDDGPPPDVDLDPR